MKINKEGFPKLLFVEMNWKKKPKDSIDKEEIKDSIVHNSDNTLMMLQQPEWNQMLDYSDANLNWQRRDWLTKEPKK